MGKIKQLFKLISLPIKFIKRRYNRFYNVLLFKLNKVNIGLDFIINGILFVSNNGRITIGDNFRANSSKNSNPIGGDTILRLFVKNNGILTIGSNVGISNSTIVCWEKIIIGSGVYIGGGCKIWDTNFHSIDPIERVEKGDRDVKTSPVIINNYAFIGAGSIILKGVVIGENSVIGAGSVVTKDIPDNEIWGGNPAKFIRKL